MLYPDELLLLSVTPGSTGAAPFFTDAIIEDQETAALIRRLHIILESSTSRLEQESILVMPWDV